MDRGPLPEDLGRERRESRSAAPAVAPASAVEMRTRIMNQLHVVALDEAAAQEGAAAGRSKLGSLVLAR